MATLASLAVELTANSASLVNEMKRVNKTMDSFEKKAKMVGNAVKTAIFAAASGGFATFIRDTADAMDNLGKLAGRLGISTEALSELGHVANLSGVPVSQLNTGLQRMVRRVSEAANGTGEAKKAIQELGLSASELNQLAPDKQFERIAESLSLLGNQSDKVRLAMKFFDSEGVALIQTMGDGAQGIQDMRAEAEKLGLTISESASKEAAIFNDHLTRMQGNLSGLANTITTTVVSAFNDLMEAMNAGNTIGGIALEIEETKFRIAEIQEFFGPTLSKPLTAKLEESLKGLNEKLKALQDEARNKQIEAEGRKIDALIMEEMRLIEARKEFIAEEQALKAEAMAKEKEILNAKFEEVQERTLTEQEILRNKFVEELAIVEQYYNDRAGLENEKGELLYKIRSKYIKDLGKIEEKARKDNVKDDKEQWATLLANNAVAANSVKDLTRNLVMDIAKDLQVKAIMGAYSHGSSIGGPYVGAAFAAIAAVATTAIISKLGGGGSSAPTSATSAPDITAQDDIIAANDETTVEKNVIINVSGISDDSLLTAAQRRQIIDEINEAEGSNTVIRGL